MIFQIPPSSIVYKKSCHLKFMKLHLNFLVIWVGMQEQLHLSLELCSIKNACKCVISCKVVQEGNGSKRPFLSVRKPVIKVSVCVMGACIP